MPRRHTLHRNINAFKEYVADQDPHIHQLLKDVDLSDTMARALSDMLYATQDLHTGTDGRLLNDIGTFGFIWGNPATHTIITKGKGMCQVRQAISYRHVQSYAGYLRPLRTSIS